MGHHPAPALPDESPEEQRDFASLLQQVSFLQFLGSRDPPTLRNQCPPPNISHLRLQLRVEPSKPEESEAKFTIFTA